MIKQHTRIFTLLRAGRKRKHNFHQHFCPSYFFPPPPVYCNNAFGQVGVLPIPPDQILFTAFFPRLQMSNGDAFSEEPSGGVDRGTRERTPELAAVPSRPAAHPILAFTFHGAQCPISTLGRKWIRAGMAQSHRGTPRAAAAKSVLKRTQSKAGGGKEAHLGSWEKGVECALYGSATPASHRGQFKISNSVQSPACLHHEAAEFHPPAACWGFMAFLSALNKGG